MLHIKQCFIVDTIHEYVYVEYLNNMIFQVKFCRIYYETVSRTYSYSIFRLCPFFTDGKRKRLVVGSIPTQNLPVKSISPSPDSVSVMNLCQNVTQAKNSHKNGTFVFPIIL